MMIYWKNMFQNSMIAKTTPSENKMVTIVFLQFSTELTKLNIQKLFIKLILVCLSWITISNIFSLGHECHIKIDYRV